MKKLLFLAFVAILGNSIFAQQLTVAVSPFDIRAGFTKDDAEVIYELFVTELVGTGKVKVVEPNKSFKTPIGPIPIRWHLWVKP